MDFLNFMGQVFGGVSSLLAQIVQFVVAFFNAVIQVFAAIWQGLVAVFQWALKALQSVGGFFKHLWENFFSKIFGKVFDLLRKAHQWLETHLKPIIDWLKKAQAWLEKHVWGPMRAYIRFLQRIRQWLGILRFLHIKWAEALDRRLAQTEAELAHVFLVIRGYINSVIGWVNAASDPLRLGRMVLVSVGGRRMAGALVRMFTGLPLGVFFPHTGKGSHLWEQPVASAKDLNDPARNPPASQILLGLAPVPTEGFASTDPTPDDSEIDGLETVSYFDDLAVSMFAADAIFDAMDSPRISITDTIQEQKGQLAEAGKLISQFLSEAVTV